MIYQIAIGVALGLFMFLVAIGILAVIGLVIAGRTPRAKRKENDDKNNITLL